MENQQTQETNQRYKFKGPKEAQKPNNQARNQINRYKRNMNDQMRDLKEELNKLKSQAQSSYGNTNFQTLAKAYESNPTEFNDEYIGPLRDYLNPLRGVTKQQLIQEGISDPLRAQQLADYRQYPLLVGASRDKFNISFEKLKQQWSEAEQIVQQLQKELGKNFTPISKSQLKEMMLLDDWGTFIKAALPQIVAWGTPLIGKIYDRYVANRLPQSVQDLVQELRGGDEGFQQEDQKDVNHRVVSLDSQINTQKIFAPFSNQEVNAFSIAALIDPKHYIYTIPLEGIVKQVALSHQVLNQEVITNANGKAVVIINPTFKSQFITFNDSTTDVAAGTGLGVATDNPLVTNTAIKRYATTSYAVQFIPSVGDNSTLSSYMITSDDGNSNSLTTFANLTQLGQSERYISGKRGDILRLSTGPQVHSQLGSVPSTYSQGTIIGVQLIVESSIQQAAVGTVEVSIITQYQVDNSSKGLIQEQPWAVEERTLQAIRSLYSEYPILYYLTDHDAQRVASQLKELGKCSFNQLQQAMKIALAGITTQNRGSQNVTAPNISKIIPANLLQLNAKEGQSHQQNVMSDDKSASGNLLKS